MRTQAPDAPAAAGAAGPPDAAPPQAASALPLAGPTARIVAYGIDCAVILVLELALGAALLLSPAAAGCMPAARDILARLGGDGSLGVTPGQLRLALALLAAALALQFAVEFVYFLASELLGGGRSVGKRLLGLEVVRTGGRPLTGGASLVRNVLRAVDLLPGTYLVGLAAILASRRQQRLGDLAAGTVVVRRGRG